LAAQLHSLRIPTTGITVIGITAIIPVIKQ